MADHANEELIKRIEQLEQRIGRPTRSDFGKQAAEFGKGRRKLNQPRESKASRDIADRITNLASRNGILVEWTASNVNIGGEVAGVCCCCGCGCHCYA